MKNKNTNNDTNEAKTAVTSRLIRPITVIKYGKVFPKTKANKNNGNPNKNKILLNKLLLIFKF
jgi:hypothetical protein